MNDFRYEFRYEYPCYHQGGQMTKMDKKGENFTKVVCKKKSAAECGHLESAFMNF